MDNQRDARALTFERRVGATVTGLLHSGPWHDLSHAFKAEAFLLFDPHRIIVLVTGRRIDWAVQYDELHAYLGYYEPQWNATRYPVEYRFLCNEAFDDES